MTKIEWLRLIQNMIVAMVTVGCQRSSPVLPLPADSPHGHRASPELYNPQPPTCLEWDGDKSELKRFLDQTEEPAKRMWSEMRRMEAAYAAENNNTQIITNEALWPEKYKKLYHGLNALEGLRTTARKDLRKMQKTENLAYFLEAFSNQQQMLIYCKQGERA